MSRTRQAVLVVMATLAGTLLRMLFLGSKSFWIDEVFSINYASTSPAAILNGIDSGHPPLYYLLLHYWLPLGQSEFALRLSSALVGCLAIPLSYFLADLLSNATSLERHRMAYTAVWLTALSPLLIWYSQELRSYSLLVTLGLAATLAAAHLLSRSNRVGADRVWVNVGWSILFVASMCAALYTHYAALFLVVVQAGLVAVLTLQQRLSRRAIFWWLGAWLLVCVLYAPWLASPSVQEFVASIIKSPLYPEELLASLISISATQARVLLLVIVLFAVLAALAIGTWQVRRGADAWNRWAAAPIIRNSVLLLFVALTIFAVVPRLYTLKKFVVELWPYGLLVVAWIFPWKRANRLPLVILLTTSLLASMVNLTLIPKEQWRELAAYVSAHAEATDSIWFVKGYEKSAFSFYLDQALDSPPGPSTLGQPTLGQPTEEVEASEAAPVLDIRSVEPTVSDAKLVELFEQGQRVWLINYDDSPTAGEWDRRVVKWMNEHFMPVEQVRFHGIVATLYDPLP